MSVMQRIEKSKFTGYLWKSNSTEPELIFNAEREFEFNNYDNPFIIEGNLFDGTVSYNVKYIDGMHLITKFVLKELPPDFSETAFIPSFKGVSELIFRQYWIALPDPLCEGMEVLKPAQFVFVGINK